MPLLRVMVSIRAHLVDGAGRSRGSILKKPAGGPLVRSCVAIAGLAGAQVASSKSFLAIVMAVMALGQPA
jgi:hypothetical protein